MCITKQAIVTFCCLSKILWLELVATVKFKVSAEKLAIHGKLSNLAPISPISEKFLKHTLIAKILNEPPFPYIRWQRLTEISVHLASRFLHVNFEIL